MLLLGGRMTANDRGGRVSSTGDGGNTTFSAEKGFFSSTDDPKCSRRRRIENVTPPTTVMMMTVITMHDDARSHRYRVLVLKKSCRQLLVRDDSGNRTKKALTLPSVDVQPFLSSLLFSKSYCGEDGNAPSLCISAYLFTYPCFQGPQNFTKLRNKKVSFGIRPSPG